jgi:hypothetical protein
MRTLESVDGKPFDASAHTPESTRALFSAHDWALVVDAFSELNRAKNDEVKSFRATFRLSARDAG